MKIFLDYKEFRARTRPVVDEFDIDIVPDIGLAMFLPDRLEELQQYCRDNPQFHIMSLVKSSVIVNGALSTAHLYFLGEGDPNPELIHTFARTQKGLESLKICEFNRD
jgi:hypothetical protein